MTNQNETFVISGVAGRFPESENVSEFEEHLYKGDDMITDDNRRFDIQGLHEVYGLPIRSGKLKTIDRFDSQAFGISPKQTEVCDPGLRMLMEVAHEAIMDAGENAVDLRGKRIGVWSATSLVENTLFYSKLDNVDGYGLLVTDTTMHSNRISYNMGFIGPSLTINTACSSSIVALDMAMNSLRRGECEGAMIFGNHLHLTPVTALHLHKMNMTAPDGKSRAFDSSGKGYARAEAVCGIFIQKSKDAKRQYAELVHTRCSSDGYKQQGIAFPSGQQQVQLMRDFYAEIGIDPINVNYVEAHGTGTPVGDPQEGNAIAEIFCTPARNEPLLIGSVKSNMGHPEPAAGICQIVKVVLAMERGSIPPTLHYLAPNPNIPALVEGRMKVVAENTPVNGDYMAINSFGIGGANGHTLLRRPEVLSDGYNSDPASAKNDGFTEVQLDSQLICYAGRTEAGVKKLLQYASDNIQNEDVINLLGQHSHRPMPNMPCRGFNITKFGAEPLQVFEHLKGGAHSGRQVWFIYTGMGSQWSGMANSLMHIPVFRKSIEKCCKVLDQFEVDLFTLLNEKTQDIEESALNAFISIAAMQIALTDLLSHLGVKPDGIVGHSFGEIASAYADGCLTLEQSMLTAYWRGYCVKIANLDQGSMAAVAMNIEEATKLAKIYGVTVACHNGDNSVTLSGDPNRIDALIADCKSKEFLAKKVKSCNVAFHSPVMEKVANSLEAKLEKVIATPIARSTRWISTSLPEMDKKTLDNIQISDASIASANYFAQNSVNKVLFYDAIQKIPEDAVVLEVSPHQLLKPILKASLPSTADVFGLLDRKSIDNCQYFLKALGSAYILGLTVKWHKLYKLDEPRWPVKRGTPMLGSLMEWNHEHSWNVVDFEKMTGNEVMTKWTVDCFSTENTTQKFLLDHQLQTRPLIPFTFYVMQCWETFCKFRKLNSEETSVILENLRLYEPTYLTDKVEFTAHMGSQSSHMEVSCNGKLVFETNIKTVSDSVPFFTDVLSEDSLKFQHDTETLTKNEIYRQLRLRGYDYTNTFQSLRSASCDGKIGQIEWRENWITFADTMLQLPLLQKRKYKHLLPISMDTVIINPKRHREKIVSDGDHKFIWCYSDRHLKVSSAGGIEIRNALNVASPRKLPTSHIDVTDQNMLVPYFNDECFKIMEKFVEKAQHSCERIEKLVHSLKAKKINRKTSKDLVGSNLSLLAMLKLNILDEEFYPLEEKEEIEAVCSDPFWNCAWDQKILAAFVMITIFNSTKRSFKATSLGWKFDGMVDSFQTILNGQTSQDAQWKHICCSKSKISPTNVKELDVDSLIPDPQSIIILDRFLFTIADPQKLLKQLQAKLYPDGYVIVCEFTSMFEVRDAISNVFSGEPYNNKHNNRWNHDEWCALFNDAEYTVCSWQRDTRLNWFTTFLLKRKTPLPREEKSIIVNVDDSETFSWLPAVKTAFKAVNKPDSESVLWLTSNNCKFNGLRGMVTCMRREVADTPIMPVRYIKNCESKPLTKDSMAAQMKYNHFDNQFWKGKWCLDVFYRVSPEGRKKKIKTENAFLTILTPRNLGSLTWIQNQNGYFDNMKSKTDRLCKVYCSSLNFRDIMLATGRINPDRLPGKLKTREFVMGSEFAGRDAHTGERIFGMVESRSIGTDVVTDASLTLSMPDFWSYAEAVTIPVVYLTSYYGMIMRGRLQPGESVLIHSGSGGVGQAAIRVATSLGCTIFTTVGSVEKRAFVRKMFPHIPNSHIGDSRSTSFEPMIRHLTNGKGVDMVLNSLIEDKLQAGINCLAKQGRFIELGKHDLLVNNPLYLKHLLKNVEIHGVSLEHLLELKKEVKEAIQMIYDGIKAGVVHPLHFIEFDVAETETALRLMAQGKHMGKIVINIRDDDGRGIVLPSKKFVNAMPVTFFNPKMVCLLTGGLGGMGMEISEWLTQRGVRNLVITSRVGIKTGYQKRAVKYLRDRGINVVVTSEDISDLEQARSLLLKCVKIGEIESIFHLSTVLKDVLVENQTPETFEAVAKMKYKGTMNLDVLSKEMCPKLTRFVVFSSGSSAYGNLTQMNYGWANSAMESMMRWRRRDGYHGLAIQWGLIGDAGITMDAVMPDNNLFVMGMAPQRMFSVFEHLDAYMNWDDSVVCSYVRDVSKKRTVDTGSLTLKQFMELIEQVFGTLTESNFDKDIPFGELGADSLMIVELQELILKQFDENLSPDQVRGLTVSSLEARYEAKK